MALTARLFRRNLQESLQVAFCLSFRAEATPCHRHFSSEILQMQKHIHTSHTCKHVLAAENVTAFDIRPPRVYNQLQINALESCQLLHTVRYWWVLA